MTDLLVAIGKDVRCRLLNRAFLIQHLDLKNLTIADTRRSGLSICAIARRVNRATLPE